MSEEQEEYEDKPMFMLAEYCPGPFYMGWHLYLRDNKNRQQRNADGNWGWIFWNHHDDRGVFSHPCQAVFDGLGIEGSLLGGCGDKSAIARFAFSHKIPRQRIGGKPRGCIEVIVDEYARARLPPAPAIPARSSSSAV